MSPPLPPGTYSVTAELARFKRVGKNSVIVTTGSRVNAGTFVLDVGAVSETITVEAEVGRLQLRLEMFNVLNHTQFSGRNLNTNLTNAAGQTGAAILNDYSGVAVTNNVRPAGDTRPLGTFFGEYNAARDPRIVQMAVKLYF